VTLKGHFELQATGHHCQYLENNGIRRLRNQLQISYEILLLQRSNESTVLFKLRPMVMYLSVNSQASGKR